MDPNYSLDQGAVLDLEICPRSVQTVAYFGEDSEADIGSHLLTLRDALEIAVANARQYQNEKESLYLEALSLSMSRHRFTPIFSAGASGDYSEERSDEEIAAGIDKLTTERSVEVGGRAGADRLLKAGGRIAAAFATDFFRYLLHSGERQDASSSLVATLSQPLLRGAGYRAAMENLTQAERNLLYSLRNFARFRKEFTVSIVTEYYRVLQDRDRVRNAWQAYQNFKDNVKRENARYEEGMTAKADLAELQESELTNEQALKKKAYEGAVRLNDEGYLTPNELQEKRIVSEKSENAVESAQASLELFKTYDLQKTAEQYLLNYEQVLLELARVKSDALAELSDAIGDVEWSRRHHNRERNQLDDLERQLARCVIRAERPGLVVSGDGKEKWDRDEIIREGATVRERQAIITIPDMSKMGLIVRIHESQVKRIQVGQSVRITVDAEPEKKLMGVVQKVGVLPDSENQRLNPDQKVYLTTITIDGLREWLKPGMTAKADIVISELQNVVYVPLQAVIPHEEAHVCFVENSKGPELRILTLLDYNNRFVAVQSGLEQGDLVYLHVPKGIDLDKMGPVNKSKNANTPSLAALIPEG